MSTCVSESMHTEKINSKIDFGTQWNSSFAPNRALRPSSGKSHEISCCCYFIWCFFVLFCFFSSRGRIRDTQIDPMWDMLSWLCYFEFKFNVWMWRMCLNYVIYWYNSNLKADKKKILKSPKNSLKNRNNIFKIKWYRLSET